MSKLDTLFGAALGAAIVGTTLVVHDALTDPETAPQVRERIRHGVNTVGEKASNACRTVGRRASALGREVYARVEDSETVRRIRRAGEELFHRTAAEAETSDASEETYPVADGNPPQEIPDDPLADGSDTHFHAT